MIEILMAAIHTGKITVASAEKLFTLHILWLQIGGAIDHTWPIILLFAALGLIVYILFGIILRNKNSTAVLHMTDNIYSATDAEYILLVGSETGGTRIFAQEVLSQLINSGLKAYLTDMDSYTEYPQVKYLMVLTSTYGEGDAPSSASRFLDLLQKTSQTHKVNVSVVGFGSEDYSDFCGYSEEVFRALQKQSWADISIPLHKINDKSAEQFCEWIKSLINYYSMPLIASPALFSTKPKELNTFIIADRFFSKDGQLFRVRLKTDSKVRFVSGDLIAIYPADDNRERFYSVSRIGDAIELVVREFPNGLGSPFLKNSPVGTSFQARIMGNPQFHFPDNKRQIIMIANGTGIAPFRGMIKANNQVPIHLFYGSREREVYDSFLKQELDQYLLNGKLSGQYLAFSRDKEKQYITELITQQSALVTQVLRNKGTIMICGSLSMQKDVIEQISTACKQLLQMEIQTYMDNGQIVSDCY